MPVGSTAKVRSAEAAARLAQRLTNVGKAIGLDVRIVRTDGTQPVGRGIGPALEARDVLAVLQNQPAAPADLRERALLLAGEVVELCGASPPGGASGAAREALASGAAWRKFQAICAAQGGMRDIPRAEHRHVVAAAAAGRIAASQRRRSSPALRATQPQALSCMCASATESSAARRFSRCTPSHGAHSITRSPTSTRRARWRRSKRPGEAPRIHLFPDVPEPILAQPEPVRDRGRGMNAPGRPTRQRLSAPSGHAEEFLSIGAALSLVFSASVGFGVVTPVLPAALMQMRPGLSAEQLAWHTGLLTGVYTFMGFGLARLWGQLSDRVGRKSVLLAAAAGHAIMLTLFPLVPGLLVAYLLRARAGLFAAAIVPVGLAWLSDFSPQPLRARRFAALTIASLLGFLVGPVIGASLGGGPGSRWLQQTGFDSGGMALPFFAAGAIGAAAWFICLLAPAWRAPAATGYDQADAGTAGPLPNLVALITMGGAVAFALGGFEVGLTLLSTQALQLSQAKLAAMFVECSVVMIVAQVLISVGVFDGLPPRAVLAAGAVILTLGFGLLPFSGAAVAMALSIAAVAASAGILLPLLSYWTSLQSVHARGAALGTQSSFASLGQALGSSSAGGLFALAPGAPFWAGALAVAISWLAVSALASPPSVQHVE